MKRRDFIRSTAAGALALGFSGISKVDLLANTTSKPRWYKGNLHCHSQWSDGHDLPEVILKGYIDRGYDFLCLSDHNIIQKDTLRFSGFGMNYQPKNLKPFEGESSFWKRVAPNEGWPNLISTYIQKAQEIFGEDSIVTKETEDGLYVRLKTLKELREQFEERDKFLLIPGFEMTSQYVHVNLINVDKDFLLEGPDMQDLLINVYDHATKFYADQTDPYIFQVNHPQWQYYNIQPSYFFKRPNIRFVELTNNNTSWAYPEEAWTPEHLWDIVNAYRAKNEQPKLLATGTDDSHGVYRTGFKGFYGWTHVYSDSLDSNSIVNAMNQGRSYVSTGLQFAEIKFDGNTLAVKLDPQVEGQYRIEFVGTKKGYDESFKILETGNDAAKTPARKIECWSKEIGKVLETVDGIEGSYTLKADDLYVRAKAYRIGASHVDQGTDYKISPVIKDAAWTQPYRTGEQF